VKRSKDRKIKSREKPDMTGIYWLFDKEWNSINAVWARSFKEARALFEPRYKGTFWLECARSGESKKVRL
jgi:hypothetical protein